MADWRNFNDTAPIAGDTRQDVRTALLAHLDSVLATWLPHGRVRGERFVVGDVHGSAGESLEVVLSGAKAGLWTDRATGQGGDIFDLIAAHAGWDAARDFSRVLEAARTLLAQPASTRAARHRPEALGAATARWDYRDAHGQLLACVYRYDPPGRRKQFRPWDARKRCARAPTPRPLFHQPGLLTVTEVVLVEGEKCAQALIEAGVCATTAMHGANAPVDKTDWSPLRGKHVLVWPDHDEAGRHYARAAAGALLAAHAASCAVLQPPSDKPEHWDAADALAEGFDVAGFLRAGERVVMTAPAAIDWQGLDWRSDDGLASAFTRCHSQDWRYCAAWGQWLGWNGMRWNVDRTLAAYDLVRQVCRAAAQHTDKARERAKLTAAATIAGVERLARADRAHAATHEEWDVDAWGLNTPGGWVDLHSGRVRPHTRQTRSTRLTTASLGATGAPARWLAFLADITAGDTALQSYLQRVAGYCLTGATSEHALFFLYGTGANGKSVFINLLASLWGDYAAHAPMDAFMDTHGERHPTELAGLRGARLVVASETEQGRRWNESKLKAITGGDPIAARFMRQDFFEYTPQFKLLIAGNHKPTIRTVDEAMKRRLHLVPFTVTIAAERRDGQLLEKLRTERDDILTWAVAGCLQWQRDGLQPPPCVREATADYFETEDVYGRWLTERTEADAHAFVLVRELYADYRDWSEANGEYAGSVKALSAALLQRDWRPRRDGTGQRGFTGLRLRTRALAYGYKPWMN